MNARVYRDFILVLHEPRFGGAFLTERGRASPS
jgi:hypothetical protein